MRRIVLPICFAITLLTGCGGGEPSKPAVLNSNTPGAGAADASKADPPKFRMKGGKGQKSEGSTLEP